jgi:hypothetical protein
MALNTSKKITRYSWDIMWSQCRIRWLHEWMP